MDSGERRFFRVCFKWLAKEYPEIALRNLINVPEYGRWDDLYSITYANVDVATEAFKIMKNQLELDRESLERGSNEGVSLLAKWLKSENASSKETKELAEITRKAFHLSHKEYRKILSALRSRINIVEKLMSEGKWERIQYAKLPSRAGLIYRNAFARRDAERYNEFINSKETKVNAITLYPYDIAHKAFNCDDNLTDRAVIQKYWDNLPNYYGDNEENGIAIVDVSGSMRGRPMEAAVSLGAYIAEKAHGPFANHFITFSDNPQLVKFEGVDIVDKFNRTVRADWGRSTNIEATFDMLLDIAKREDVKSEDIPTRLYIFSDMEFNMAMSDNSAERGWWYDPHCNLRSEEAVETLLEKIERKWAAAGYQLPKVIFWNLDARQNNIPALGEKFSHVSGLSPVLVETILSGKTGIDLMIEKLVESGRYDIIK